MSPKFRFFPFSRVGRGSFSKKKKAMKKLQDKNKHRLAVLKKLLGINGDLVLRNPKSASRHLTGI